MENMRDSGVKWIGDIPSHWEIAPIKYFGVFDNGLTYSPKDITDNSGILVLRSSNIQSDKLDFKDCVYVKNAPNSLMVEPNDIIICSRNGSAELVGKCTILEKELFATFGAFMMRFKPKNINAKFSYYTLQIAIQSYKSLFATSTINQLTKSTTDKIIIPVPPLAEQTAIANYLDKVCAQIDDIIEETKKSAEDYKKLRLSVISEAVTCGLDKNAEMKKSGVEWIGKVPKGWKITRIKNVIKIENGSDPKTEGKIPVYGSGSESFKTCGEYKEGPTVLLGRKGATLHIPHYIEGRYWNVDTAFNTIVINDLIDLKYFYYLSFCFDYNSYMSQTTLPSMTQSNYSAMNIPYPPMNEQKAIAEYLDKKCAAIDEIIAEKENLITDLELYKKSLIYETVTGKRKAV